MRLSEIVVLESLDNDELVEFLFLIYQITSDANLKAEVAQELLEIIETNSNLKSIHDILRSDLLTLLKQRG